jgi:hypothetical protein
MRNRLRTKFWSQNLKKDLGEIDTDEENTETDIRVIVYKDTE